MKDIAFLIAGYIVGILTPKAYDIWWTWRVNSIEEDLEP